MRLRTWVPAFLACFFLGSPCLAYSPGSSRAQTIAGLGTLEFPTTTRSPQAQIDFIRGVLLLHVFEYTSAASAFQAAEALDPGFTMAYWGEAMTANHPVWNQLNQEAGQRALAKLAATAAERAAHAPDRRERAYLAAVEILYDPAGTKVERDARYADAMRALSAAYPEDDEARLFYSLALLGKSEGKRNVPVYLEAAGIAKSVFLRNPQHPGAAHYWIHGMDDPEHARGALPAAEALSKIAPDAGHAQHMCSHIFMALGMWDEVVEANEAATRVVAEQDRAAGWPVVACFHYNQWLEYGYFQQGRRRKAEQMVESCRQSAQQISRVPQGGHAGMPQMRGAPTPEAHRRAANASLIEMRDIAVIESEDWSGAAARLSIDLAGQGGAAGWYAFASGYAAALRGDADGAGKALQQLQAAEHASDPAHPLEPGDRVYLSVLEDELAAVLADKGGNAGEAIARAKQASATYESQPFDFGPPVVVKPPEELLGELLLATGDGAGAVRAFDACLRLAPNRTQSLVGLARAHGMAGEASSAQVTWRQVLAQWNEADADLPKLAEAHRALVVAKGPQAALNARLQDVHRACSEQGDGGERDHSLHHHDQLGPAGEHGDVCW